MKSLARYAATNALTRTMLSELVSRAEYESIIHSGSVGGAWLALRKTAYRTWVPEEPPGDLLEIERVFREVTARRFKRSIRELSNEPREVAQLLLSRWDLDNLEFALRLWHGRDRGLQKFLTYPSFVHEIPVYNIVEAESLEEIGLALRNTPYLEPVTQSLAPYRTRKSIFFVEVALERDYYRRLLERSAELGGADWKLAQKIIGAEIDLVNLSWLTRLLEYYHMEPGALHQSMIPGPSAITRRLAEPGLTMEKLKRLRSELVTDRIGGNGEGQAGLDSISFLEALVGDLAVETASSTLAGYPFSIGCVFAFHILKRIELRNLNTAFTGKWLGSEEAEISRKLYGLR
jgi:V/A-type H+-transporting ATPase subunit C